MDSTTETGSTYTRDPGSTGYEGSAGFDPTAELDTWTDAPGGAFDPSRIVQKVRENPLGTIALAAGVGFLLKRGDLLPALFDRRPTQPRLDPERELLLAWLNDAYAMEKAQIPVLENHAKDAEDYPKIRKQDLEHLKETKRHAELVKDCIHALGARPSKAKEAIGRVGGALNSVASEPFEDEIVKNFLADYAAERLEIISYRAIIAAAEDLGEKEIARNCRKILKDEEKMAAWLEDNIDMAVSETMASYRGRRRS